MGIVGRTGSGNSSVVAALARLFELERGRVLLGGVDAATCGVGLLRRKLTIVPQDPVLFSGALRKNLDPLGTCSGAEVWDALRRCALEVVVCAQEDGLKATFHSSPKL